MSMNVYAMNAGHIFHRLTEKIGLIISLIYLICPVLIPDGILQSVVHEIKYNGYATGLQEALHYM